MSKNKKIKSDLISKSTPIKKHNKPQSSINFVSSKDSNAQLPQFVDVLEGNVEGLLFHKLQLCSVTYSFLEDTMIKEKETKCACLKELVLFISTKGNISALSEPIYRCIAKTISDNIFRTLPPKELSHFDPEYDEQAQEASWPHLKLVYDFFLHFINSPETNIEYLRKVINRSFVMNLLEVFSTEDVRERESLKNLLLSIYLKLFEQRESIRKQIRNIFLNYIYEEGNFTGISELLQVLSMAVNTFKVPLKQEHKDCFTKVLIPLHKTRCMVFYQTHLIECLKGFIKKDEKFAEDIIMGILKFWPKTNTEKEVLFLHEIGELADMISSDQFVKIQYPLMKQISTSISSLHFQVAETALYLWDNTAFSRLISENLDATMPLVLPELVRVAKNHWNHNISELASSVLVSFYNESLSQFNTFLALSHFS